MPPVHGDAEHHNARWSARLEAKKISYLSGGHSRRVASVAIPEEQEKDDHAGRAIDRALADFTSLFDDHFAASGRVKCPSCHRMKRWFCARCVRWLPPRSYTDTDDPAYDGARGSMWTPTVGSRFVDSDWPLPFNLDIIVRDDVDSATGIQAALVQQLAARNDSSSSACEDSSSGACTIRVCRFPDTLLYDSSRPQYCDTRGADHAAQPLASSDAAECTDSIVADNQRWDWQTRYDPSTTYILYPSEHAVTLRDISNTVLHSQTNQQLKWPQTIIVPDTKWNNDGGVLAHPALAELPHLKLEHPPKVSRIWRCNPRAGPGCVCTAEALFCLALEASQCFNRDPDMRCADVLLLLFAIIRRHVELESLGSSAAGTSDTLAPFDERRKAMTRQARKQR